MNHDTLSILAIICSICSVVIGALLRYAITNRDREVDKRISDLEKDDNSVVGDVKKLTEKQHSDEVSRTRLEGEVKLLAQANGAIDRDLKDIKTSMVSRTEWTEAQSRIESAQARLETKLDTALSIARYRPTPLSMPAAPHHRPLPREEAGLDEYKIPRKDR